MLRKVLYIALAVGSVAFIGGCSGDSTSSSQGDISEEFGGFRPTDEAPAFGDEAIATEMVDDTEFDDPMLIESDVEEVVANVNADIYAIRIIWGQLRYDPEVTDVTDWSGSLTVSRGVEILRRIIRFEDGQDYILDRTTRESIEWVSKTTVHHDGIFVNVIIPPEEENTKSVPVTITYDTEPFEVTFDIDELATLDTVYYIDDSNAIAFHAFKVERVGCPKGFLAGRWGKNEEGENVFYGKWMSHHNILKGHLRGTWGDNEFYGKYIDKDGLFEGLIKGRYHAGNSASPRHRHAGWFRGYYYNAEGSILGVLKGHYIEVPKETGMGFFQGRWRHYCGDRVVVDDGLDE